MHAASVVDVQSCFSATFADARQRLLANADAAGLSVESHRHPLPGPDGEALSTETVLIGDPGAANLVVMISGTHGVETLCGSACQSLYLAGGGWRSLPADTCFLIVHAINPWGAAHGRRNNEDNIDLSRNFMNFDQPLPENPKYEALRAAIDCPDYRGKLRDRANALHRQYIADNSINDYVDAIMGGQYRYAEGFAYGGDAPAWGNRLLRELLSRFSASAQVVRVIEYHSGLGPYGYGSAVTMQVGDDLQRVRSLYGGWVDAPNDRDNPYKERFHRVQGTPFDGIRESLPDAELSAIVVEFGTYPPFDSLQALLDDHWLTQYGDPGSDLGVSIRRRVLDYHYPTDPDWRDAVASRSAQVIAQTLRGLG